METHIRGQPDVKGYMKIDEDPASDASLEVALEKMGLLSENTPSVWKRHSQSFRIQCLIHTMLILTEIAVCFLFFRWTVDRYSHGPNLRYTPARSRIVFEQRIFEYTHIFQDDFQTLNPNKPNKFNGPYSLELEEAWDGLMKHQNLRLSKEELGAWADDAALVELPDGGYFATLATFHSLHCVRRIHMILHREDYYPNTADYEWIRIVAHAEHCLDDLRQNIQCGADTTVLPFHWGTLQPVPLNKDLETHKCVNWDILNEWTKARSFKPLTPGYLIHPTLGSAYPDGEGNELGIVLDKVLALDKAVT